MKRRLEITMEVQDGNINSYSHQLFKGLQHNSALVRLNLSETGLVATEDTAKALTTMLQVNKTLTDLDLSHNEKFSDSGAYCVFLCLQHNFTLVHLNLSDTGLVATEDTAQALTKMLQVNKTLTHLNLSHNEKFSDSGAYSCVLSRSSTQYLTSSLESSHYYRTCSYRGYCSGTHCNASSQQNTYTPLSIEILMQTQELTACVFKVFNTIPH